MNMEEAQAEFFFGSDQPPASLGRRAPRTWVPSQNTRSIVMEGEGGLPIGGVRSASSTASRQPTERQVAFASRLATEVGTTIPAEALESISSMSDYIANLLDQQKESHHGDHRCEARTCYETPSKHCWRKEEQRAAAACTPPVAEGPSIGFVHLFL